MPESKMTIRQYSPEDEKAVMALWYKCNLVSPANNPKLDIERKLRVNPELFLVGLLDSKVVSTVMGGYEGHRGWVNYVAVEPAYQKGGLGKQIMLAVEKKIKAKGCPKINLIIRANNSVVVGFYEGLGYEVEDRINMGKRLVDD